jgi:ubiquinone/menaquinone biosynthesis C-methylase UbiE
MTFYQNRILPGIVNHVCSCRPITRQRKKIIPLVSGRVLEIGMGTGLNLPFYDFKKIKSLKGLEPSSKMIAMAKTRAQRLGIGVRFIEESACQIPLVSHDIDSVVVTYTLCTIPDILPALREIHRVLKPGGKLYFCEHGLAPDRDVKSWQNRLTPLWKCLTGGCHLNRNIPVLIQTCGFCIQDMETMYLPGWRPLTYNYWGIAIKG